MQSQFTVNMGSEAIITLDNLVSFNPNQLVQEMRRDVVREAGKSYKRAWGGMKDMQINNVYRAVKQAVLDKSQRGRLTDSTINAIKSRVTGNTVEAGIFGGTWPSNSGSHKVSMGFMSKYLEDLWNLDPGTIARKLSGYGGTTSYAKAISRKRKIGMAAAVQGDVAVEWDSGGFRIVWPSEAKRALNLHDVDIPSEPFESKQYKTNRSDRFFLMSQGFINQISRNISKYIDGVIERGIGEWPGGEPVVAGRKGRTRIADKETQDKYSSQMSTDPDEGITVSTATEYQESQTLSMEIAEATKELIKMMVKSGASKAEIDMAVQWYKNNQ